MLGDSNTSEVVAAVHRVVATHSSGVIDTFTEDVLTTDEAVVMICELNGQAPGLPGSLLRYKRRHELNRYFARHNIPMSGTEKTTIVRTSDVMLYYKRMSQERLNSPVAASELTITKTHRPPSGANHCSAAGVNDYESTIVQPE